METHQQPPKRVRSDSSSSSSYSCKQSTIEQNAGPSKSSPSPEQSDTQESSNNESSDGEASPDEHITENQLATNDPSQLNPNLESPESKNESESSYTLPISQSGSIPSDVPPVVYANGDWQAVYDPATNAYYFANSKTGETTWTNPTIASEPINSHPMHPQQMPDLGGIDPELARLDPHFSRILQGHSSSSDPKFTARFNAKTGRFESDPNRDPSRVSEFARARTQAESFFDVAGWEKSLEAHNGRIPGTSKETRAASIEKGKKLSKAQLEQFKKQKMEKKARNQRAWLIGSK